MPTKHQLLLLVATLILAPTAFCDDAGREVAKKEITEHFASAEEANQWLKTPQPFRSWLEAVTFPGWQPLHSAEVDGTYYALSRCGDYLVFWHADCTPDAGLPRAQISIEVTSKEDGRSVWEKPPKLATLDYRLEYPAGAVLASSQTQAFKIKDGFQGTLILNFRRLEAGETKSRSTYRQEVTWTK